MKLIVGLGNPGEQYEHTRHNTGFLVLDKLAEQLRVRINRRAFDALVARTIINGEPVVLMKPQTYMNESGRAVGKAVRYYHLDPADEVLIIYDDLDLPVGTIRIRSNGSAGGHRGIKSIINQLSTDQFDRIRVGIDRDPNIPVIDYVLGKVRKEDSEAYQQALNRAAEAAREYVSQPLDKLMNRYNGREKNG